MKAFAFALLLSTTVLARAADEDGFVSLFNGKDLTGWVNVNCAPETWSVRDGMIHCTGHPIGALRTPRQYENFILELEWRHLSSGGNSGVFIWASPIAAPGVPFLRAVEVQVLDHGFNVPGKNQWYTTHGDVFPIHGDTMKPFGRHNGMRSFPSEERSKGSPEWNHYRIVCQDGVIRLHVNGKEVSGGEDCNYRKGYLGLESEGAPIDFRNIRIKELPSSNAPANLSAPLDEGWHSLFTGLDFRGWKTNAATQAHWRVAGEHLSCRPGDSSAESHVLWTDRQFGNAEFVIDVHAGTAGVGNPPAEAVIEFRGGEGPKSQVHITSSPDKFERFIVTVHGLDVTVRRGDTTLPLITLPPGIPPKRSLGLTGQGGTVEFMNVYVRDL